MSKKDIYFILSKKNIKSENSSQYVLDICVNLDAETFTSIVFAMHSILLHLD